MYFKRHPDDDIIDEITFKTVPRYKTSDMSGDEWRVSVAVELKRKGNIMYSQSYNNMDSASSHLPWLLKTWYEKPADEIPNWIKQIKLDNKLCHQPGCSNKAEVIYKLKREFSEKGIMLDKSDIWGTYYRAFCKTHEKRGDCGREDSDRNYEAISPFECKRILNLED